MSVRDFEEPRRAPPSTEPGASLQRGAPVAEDVVIDAENQEVWSPGPAAGVLPPDRGREPRPYSCALRCSSIALASSTTSDLGYFSSSRCRVFCDFALSFFA